MHMSTQAGHDYGAGDIEILEGIEAVRRRPGMYVGGTDERAFHHLAAEILDNAVDEAGAGHADRISLTLNADGSLTIVDNGRGVPAEPHPRMPDKSTLDVIFTVLHAGGKFGGSAYTTAGGLHGVGASVVNALSERVEVVSEREGKRYTRVFARGVAVGPLKTEPCSGRGTRVTFTPDPQIFGVGARFKPAMLYQMARTKAYLFAGLCIDWRRPPGEDETPEAETLCFRGGLRDLIAAQVEAPLFDAAGKITFSDVPGSVEWAVAYGDDDGFTRSYCNTVVTPEGGTHLQGLRAGLTKAIKTHAALKQPKRAALITVDDVMQNAGAAVSLFMREPMFQGQTKEKLASPEAASWPRWKVPDSQ